MGRWGKSIIEELGMSGRQRGAEAAELGVLLCVLGVFAEGCALWKWAAKLYPRHRVPQRGSRKLLGTCITTNPFLRAASSRLDWTLGQLHCGWPRKLLLLGVLPVSFSAALYDASSKLVFGFLLKSGVFGVSCGFSFRGREAKEQHFRGRKRWGQIIIYTGWKGRQDGSKKKM